jgi:phosphatidylglycerophosphate synthase
MLDGAMRRMLDPVLDRVGLTLVRAGVGPMMLTGIGLLLGVASAAAIVAQAHGLALALFAMNRIADGLDGPAARASNGGTDRGGFVDIVADFIVYGAIPLAFALSSPATHAPAAALLLFAFYINGATFLTFAALAAKRGLSSDERGPKSIYFTAGLAEGTETIIVFGLMMLVPQMFPLLALIFGLMCLATAGARALLAWRLFA